MHVFLPIVPPTKTHQEKKIAIRNGKPIVYEDAELKDVRQKYMAWLSKFAPSEKIKPPIRLHTVWCFPITGRHRDGELKISKPDTDNLVKMLKDCMTVAGFWRDDAEVAVEMIEKFWAETPGIYIEVEQLGGRKNE
jgi:Holliday junction resolvase RusA-like endonuclease